MRASSPTPGGVCAPGAAPPRGALSRLGAASLGTKLILFSTALTVIAVSSSFLLLSIGIRRHTRNLLAGELARHQTMILSLQARSLEEVLRTSTILTESPTLRAAMETLRTETRPGGRWRADLLETVRVEVAKVGRMLGKDLLVVTDQAGRVLAGEGPDGPTPQPGEDLSSQSLVQHAMTQTTPVNRDNFAILVYRGEYFQAGCVPILLQGYIIGTLMLGERMDQDYLQNLKTSLDSEIVLTGDKRILGSTLQETAAEENTAATLLSFERGTSSEPTLVRLGGQDYVGAALPLSSGENGDTLRLWLLHSLTSALGRSDRFLILVFLSCGSLVVVGAAVAAWRISRSILLPMMQFVGFMRSVAEEGDHARRFETPNASPEIRTLVDAHTQLSDALLRHEEALRESAREELNRVERLKESEKLAALGRLLSGAAHEINNPLTGVVGNIEMVLAGGVGGEVRERLEKVQKEGRRIVALVRNLLKVAHRDTGLRSTLDLNQVLEDTVALRRHDFTSSGIRLEFDKTAHPVRLLANELELQQVFLNIINNAFDALKEAGGQPAVRLSTGVDGEKAIITFADNGPGMECPERVFEHFYTTKPLGQGTGLGLSISHAIINSHGGEIRAENAPEGGARFTVVLPLASEDLPAATPAPSEGGTRIAPMRSLRADVLVVDDEPVVLELQLSILDSVGASAVGVGSGKEAVELLKKREFHLVVSDLRMPGEISGKDLYRWVTTYRPAARRGFVFVTGDNIAESAFLDEVGVRCVLKPFTMEEYVSALRETLHALRQAA